MAAPDMTGEFNGAAQLLQGLLMWLFGMKSENGQTLSFSDIFKKLFGGDDAAPAAPGETAPQQTATPPPQSAATQTPAPLPSSAPAGTPTAVKHIVTFGDSLAQGYGQALATEFKGKADVTNYGIVGAGLKGGTHLASVDWSQIKPDTAVIMSIGTNDVGFLSSRNQAGIDKYAQDVVALAARAKAAGGTPVLVAMHAPDQPETIRDPVTKERRPMNETEFKAWKDTMTAMNDAINKAAQAQGISFVTQEGGQYVQGGVHQTMAGYRNTADNALKQAGITVTSA